MIFFHNIFHMPDSNGSTLMATIPKALISCFIMQQQQQQLRGFGPLANYADSTKYYFSKTLFSKVIIP
jgi:hypothetical protein